jgi:shikimate kinase
LGVRIFLVGMPGSGKTRLGKQLAQKLALPFADTDAEVVRQAGLSVAELFDQRGEAAFRELERAALERLLTQYEGAVIATGGGLAAEPGGIERLNEAGLTLWIDVPVAVLAERIAKGKTARPLYSGENLAEQLSQRLLARQARYALAQLRVQGASLAAADIATAIEQWQLNQAST